MNTASRRHALPEGYELHWYRIEKVLGQGGFALTYLARDINLDRQVAIKEYMPVQISMRDEDLCIHALTAEDETDYQWGLQRFISEARTLTRFEHPSLVRVINVFEANHSAYMVMNYEIGTSLQDLLKSGKTFSEAELSRLLFALMDGLEAVHSQGFVHRDIKPGNIFIRLDGHPVLLDFGSARQTRGKLESQTLTNFVSPGYAPIEQYASKSDRQGPWTDIYGLAATVYQVMTGRMPEAAIDRSVTIAGNAGDNLVRSSQICKGKYSEPLLTAIDHALAFRIEDRPQSIAEWRRELGHAQAQPVIIETDRQQPQTATAEVRTLRLTAGSPAGTRQTDRQPGHDDVVTITTEVMTRPGDSGGGRRILKILAGVAALAILGVMVVFLLRPGPERQVPDAAGAGDMVPALVPEAEPPPVVPQEPTVEDKISELLALAGEDLEALRLTTPADNNAYDKYQSVLALDPGNSDALRGIDMVSEKYLSLVYADIEAGNFNRAEHYMQKAEQVTPELPKVRIARKALRMAVEEYEESRTIFGRIKGIFQ